MPCKGCKEKHAATKSARQKWDAKATAAMSEAIALLRKHGSPLAEKFMSLNAELNQIQVMERDEKSVPEKVMPAAI